MIEPGIVDLQDYCSLLRIVELHWGVIGDAAEASKLCLATLFASKLPHQGFGVLRTNSVY